MELHIYKIENKINNKKYIGFCKNFNSRIKRHFNLLKNGKHHSNKLQRAYDKYGIDNLLIEILFTLDTDYEGIKIIEMQYIKKFNTFNKGYNCTIGGDGVVGIFGEKHWHSKPVFVYDKEGHYLKTFTSVSECAFYYKTNVGSIWSVIKNKTKIFRKEYFFTYINFGEKYVGFHNIFQYDLNGNLKNSFVDTNHLLKALNIVNKNIRININLCLNGKRGTALKYMWFNVYKGEVTSPYNNFSGYWVKINQSRKVIQADLNNNILNTFDTVTEATNFLNKKQGTLNPCLKDKTKTAYGYKWFYLDN